MKKEKTIATFSCSKSIHVYYEGCGLVPGFPCKFHSTIKAAKSELNKRGIKEPRIIKNKSTT